MSLVEPDAVNQTFDGAVEIGVFENDERRLAPEFERKPFVAGRGRTANGASDFGRTRERDLLDVRMLDQRFACRAVSRNNVDDARRQPGFLADFGKRQRC